MEKIAFGIIVVFLMICIIVLFMVAIIKLYISKIKSHNQVLHQKAIDQQKAITETIIETQENTLDIISNELHDDAGQQLTYINLQVEQFKIAHPKLQQELQPISESIGRLSDSVRDLSHTISHQKIKHANLIDSMINEVTRLNKLGVIKCRLDVSDGFKYQFSETERIILFRMFQEISNNVLKHSRAEIYNIKIQDRPAIQLSFKDNGCGFKYKTTEVTNTNGLINLKQRATLINYEFNIKAEANMGTEIILLKNKTNA